MPNQAFRTARRVESGWFKRAAGRLRLMPLPQTIHCLPRLRPCSLFDHADFNSTRERVAPIGRNGTGKSSLLAALAAGRARPARRRRGLGAARHPRRLRPQGPPFDPRLTVFEVVVAGMGESARLLAAYHGSPIAWPPGRATATPLLARLDALQHELEAGGAWAYWGPRRSRPSPAFSWIPTPWSAPLPAAVKRLPWPGASRGARGVASMNRPTTRHRRHPMARLLVDSGVTLFLHHHDRRFPRPRVSTRIVELDRGRLTSFPVASSTASARNSNCTRRFHNARRQTAQEEKCGSEGRRKPGAPGRFPLQRLDLRAERAASGKGWARVNLQLDAGDKSGQLVAELERRQGLRRARRGAGFLRPACSGATASA